MRNEQNLCYHAKYWAIFPTNETNESGKKLALIDVSTMAYPHSKGDCD